MTDQDTIPADKVREILKKLVDDGRGCPEQTLGAVEDSLRALLPAPPQPTSGLFGKWAKHPEHGDVMCIWGKPDSSGHISVHWAKKGGFNDVEGRLVLLSELTFPEQATRPEDVPAGEAWLVDVEDSEESHKSIVALKDSFDFWRTSDEVTTCSCWQDSEVTLISPLTPERPGKDDLLWKYAILQQDYAHLEEGCNDLQAKYDDLEKRWKHLDVLFSARGSFIDELNAKYREAQERIKSLEQATPRTVTTKAEYEALPIGSMFVDADDDVWKKGVSGNWIHELACQTLSDEKLAGTTRTVLRYGWGDEQPAWRIEHDHKNLRAGEYIIDKDGDAGTVNNVSMWGCKTDGKAYGFPGSAPFIAFLNRDAATPEAIEEAKNARDKEMGK